MQSIKNNGCDKIPANYKKNVNTDKTTAKERHPCMEQQHRHDSD